jgi:hypothetical protein
VVLGAVLLTVPVLALAGQALRVGSLARERRMASLRLAGATRLDIRLVPGAEAGIAAPVGGLLAGPVYVLLWFLLGVLPPAGLRLMPEANSSDALAWIVVLLLAGVGGGLAGAIFQRRAVVEPLGVRRRATPPPPGWVNLAMLVFGMVLIVGGVTHPHLVSKGNDLLLLLQLLLGLLLLAFATGPRLVHGPGILLRKRGSVENSLPVGDSKSTRARPAGSGPCLPATVDAQARKGEGPRSMSPRAFDWTVRDDSVLPDASPAPSTASPMDSE